MGTPRSEKTKVGKQSHTKSTSVTWLSYALTTGEHSASRSVTSTRVKRTTEQDTGRCGGLQQYNDQKNNGTVQRGMNEEKQSSCEKKK